MYFDNDITSVRIYVVVMQQPFLEKFEVTCVHHYANVQLGTLKNYMCISKSNRK